MSQRPLRVLLADDEASLREPLAKRLREIHGYEVDAVACANEVLTQLEQTRGGYDVALIDDLLVPTPEQEPETLGVTLTKRIKARYPNIEIIVFTGWGMQSALEALQAGAYRYLAKPFNLDELGILIQTAAEHGQLKGIAREKQILEQLMETSTALISGCGLQEILDAILHGVQCIGYDRVRLYLLSEDKQNMVGRAQVGMEVEFVGFEFSVANNVHAQSLLADSRPHVFERKKDKPFPYDRELAKEEVNQMLCVPLLRHGEFIGMLSADNKFSQRPIVEAELEPVALFATQAAAAIENARLMEKEQEATRNAEQRARNLAAVQEVSMAISSVLELDEILDATCRAAVELFDVNHSGLVIFEPGLERGQVVAEYPNLGTRGIEIPVQGIPAEEQLITSKAPLAILDIADESSLGPVRDILDRFNIRSILIVPVVFEGRVLGSFSLDSIGHLRTFTKDEINLCQVFAAQLAVAVENATTHKRVKKYAAKLEILHDIDTKMSAGLRLDQNLKSIAEDIAHLVGASESLFLLVDPHKKVLIEAIGHGYPTEHLEGMSYEEVESGVSGWVLRTGKPVLVSDVQSDPRNTGIALEKAKQFDTVPLIVAPLRIKEEVIGTLTAANTADDSPFTEEDLRLVVMLANQVTNAIENARLYREANRRGQLLTALDEALRNIRAEKETAKLLQEVVRLATELVGCAAGGLYINWPQLGELELSVTYGLPNELVGNRLPHTEGVVGLVARTGQSKIIYEYCDWPDRENIFEAYYFKTVVGVPLKQTGEVEAVLFVADSTDLRRRLTQTDLEILERFAAQASIALQTSRLLSREQRVIGQLVILHKISDYIQAAKDLDKILHVVLTGTTAGYGLCFNRAALFFLDEKRENLIGRMGIGHLDEAKAREDWACDHRHGLYDFGRYLELLEQDALPSTPVDEKIRGLRLPIGAADLDVFSQVVLERHPVFVNQDELDKLPDSFIEAFQPVLPFIVIPLVARDQVIGLLVADDKFTQSPITPEDIESLLTFANTAAIAIDNTQLLHEAKVSQKRLSSFFEASNTLVSSQDPEKILQDIVEQACAATDAYGASLVLIDQIGQVQYCVTAGVNKRFDTTNMVRHNGLSMQIMRSGQTEIIEDMDKERNRVNPNAIERDIKAAVGLPVSLEDKRTGVMWIDFDKPRRFSTHEINSMRLYVNQAAIAYDSARRIKELEYMRRAADSLAGVADLPEVLEQIVNSAQEILQADSAVIWSYDPVNDRFNLNDSIATGIPENLWKKYQKVGPRHGGTAFTVMEQGWIGVTDIYDTKQYDFLGKNTLKLLKQIEAKSFQGIALAEGKEKLGVLYMNYSYVRGFSEEEQKVARTFAHHAVLALKKAKLLDQVSKAHNTAGIVARVTALEDLQNALNTLVQGAQDALDCDATVLYTYDQDSGKLGYPPILAGVNDPESTRHFPELPRNHFIFTLLERDEPYVAENVPIDPILGEQRFSKEERVKSCIVMPLFVRDRKVGIMFINYRKPHQFTKDELTKIELFANQAAVGIHNAQLFNEAQHKAQQMATIAKIGHTINSSLDLKSTLASILSSIEPLINYTAAEIRLWDEEKEAMVVAGAAGDPRYSEKAKSIYRIDEGYTGWIIHHREPMLVTDTFEYRDVQPKVIDQERPIRSFVGIPLLSGNTLVGTLELASEIPNAFDEDDKSLLIVIGENAVSAITNARLFEDTERKARLLDSAAQVASRATSLLKIDELLTETVRLISERFNFYHTAVFLLDNDRKHAVLQGGYPKDNDAWLKPGYKLKVGQQGIVGFVASVGKPHRAPNVKEDPYYFAGLPHTCAEMAFPLIARRQVIGVLDAQSTKVGDWQNEDIATLQTMANQLANAIHNAQLYQQLGERLEESNTLQQVAVSLAGTSELQEILNFVMKAAMKLTETDYGNILFWDAQTEKFTEALKTGPDGMLQPYQSMVRANGLTRRIIDTQKSIVISDILKVTNMTINPAFKKRGFRATVGVLLLCRGEIIGVLYIRDRKPRQFSKRQVELLETLASQAVVAIDRARQFEELKRTKGLVGARTAVAWMGMISAAWRHAIEGYAITIKEEIQHLRNDSPRTYLDKINKRLIKIERLARLIMDKPITPPLTEEEDVESVPINELLRERTKQLWENDPYKSVQQELNFELYDTVTVRASREWLRRCFDVLVDNAVEAMVGVSLPMLTISTRLMGSNVEIVFSDNGKGISKDTQAKLLHEPIRKSQGDKGLGMGLLMAQTIVQAYGGEIRIEATDPKGTSMVISFPIENQNM